MCQTLKSLPRAHERFDTEISEMSLTLNTLPGADDTKYLYSGKWGIDHHVPALPDTVIC